MKTYSLIDGKLITDNASIKLSAIIAFQGETLLLENGETLRLSESLANALKDYLRDIRQVLERTQTQA